MVGFLYRLRAGDSVSGASRDDDSASGASRDDDSVELFCADEDALTGDGGGDCWIESTGSSSIRFRKSMSGTGCCRFLLEGLFLRFCRRLPLGGAGDCPPPSDLPRSRLGVGILSVAGSKAIPRSRTGREGMTEGPLLL